MDRDQASNDNGMRLPPYERRVQAEIERWQNEKDGLLTKGLNVS